MLDLQNYQSGVYKIYEFPNSYVCQFHDVEAPQSTYILGSEYSEIYEFTLVNNVLN
jgi:hypothetical protein